jgi:hypothetical protein
MSPFAAAPGYYPSSSYSHFIADDPDPPPALPFSGEYYANYIEDDTADDVRGGHGGTGRQQKAADSPRLAKAPSKKHIDQPCGYDTKCRRSWLYDPWVSFEFLFATLEGRATPPLVTTSPPGSEGKVPGAEILFGGDKLGGDMQAAGRLAFGAWLDPAQRVGVMGKFFALEGESIRFSAGSDETGDPLLARPFYEVWPAATGGVGPASFIISGVRNIGDQTFVLAGDVNVNSETDLLTAEALARFLVFCRCGHRLDLIAGYQFGRIDDSLRIEHRTDITPGIFGARVEAFDMFDVCNKFHGGQLGLLTEFDRGPLTLSMLGKVGLGNMNQVVTISGGSRVTDVAGGVSTYEGGILALPTNIGTYKRDKFTVVPEAEVKLTWRMTKCLDFSVGYTVMYWSDVALAAGQIDTSQGNLPTINSSQWFGGTLEGPANPLLDQIRDTDLWLHALSLAVTLRI